MARALLNTDTAAELVGIHPESLRRLWRNGVVPGYKAGRLLRFDVDEVRDALRTNKPPQRATATAAPNFDALERAQ
jgi:excisionase family DNA binding protein